ncbi:hypothetical protein MNBD_ALPHA12-456 [hydrothermal vent metagenome]|uniref:Uncharacterized protein n=1 Tax=hydrothermal vent metagenome TaxID=652676 RepID=A0A3B0TH72_9ZZZZ
MAFEFFLALFIMAVGLSISGAATSLYQGMAKQDAYLRYDGQSYFGMIGNLIMSFVCGPYIMMNMGWQSQGDGSVSLGNMLLGSLIAFGWAFINGLLFLGIYFAITG